MIEKEVRALLPAWTACAIAVVASRYQIPALVDLGLPAYLVGVAGLGAWSVGHEYAHGTLASMLALPVARRRWWLAKLAILVPALAALAALAASFVVLKRGDAIAGRTLFWMPAIAALAIAPWLTMLTRSALAGAVFTLGLIGSSIALGDWIGVYRYGSTSEVDGFRWAFMTWSLGSLSLVGVVAGWRTFAGLQDVGTQERDWQLVGGAKAALTSAGARRRPPLVALLLKELCLQQLAFAVAGVYAAGTVVVLLAGRPDVFGVFDVLVALYVISVPALIGSLACAEERQFGTLDSQLLLPIAASTQWLVKSATAIGLAVVLALLLPAALLRLLPASAVHVGPVSRLINGMTVVIVLGSASVSLYVSTLARSGMAALMYSVAAIPGFAFAISRVGSWTGERAFEWVHQARGQHAHRMIIDSHMFYSIAIFVAFVAAVAALALTNYRDADRRPALVALHATVLMAGVIGYSVAINVLMALRY